MFWFASTTPNKWPLLQQTILTPDLEFWTLPTLKPWHVSAYCEVAFVICETKVILLLVNLQLVQAVNIFKVGTLFAKMLWVVLDHWVTWISSTSRISGFQQACSGVVTPGTGIGQTFLRGLEWWRRLVQNLCRINVEFLFVLCISAELANTGAHEVTKLMATVMEDSCLIAGNHSFSNMMWIRTNQSIVVELYRWAKNESENTDEIRPTKVGQHDRRSQPAPNVEVSQHNPDIQVVSKWFSRVLYWLFSFFRVL